MTRAGRALGCVLLLASCGRKENPLQGETDAKQVNVAAKVPGRVDSLYVQEGDSVRRGKIVATLDGPEIRAKAAQALAARDAARSEERRVGEEGRGRASPGL